MKEVCLYLIVCFATFQCTLSDLRPLRLQVEGPAEIDNEKGRLMLQQWSELIHKQGSQPRLSLTLTDHWPSFFTRFFNNPWPESPQLLKVEISPENQRVTYEHDGKNVGLNLKAFQDENHVEVAHWLRLIYSFTIPSFDLAQANMITYAGDAAAAGKSYYLVLATGGSLKPNRKHDQYLVWLNQQTGLAEYIQYTMRKVKPFLYGTIELSDMRLVSGFKVPFRYRVLDYPGSDYVIRDIVIKSFSVKGLL